MLTNYRPISILSQTSKIFDKLISNRINDYFEKYHLIFDKHFGSRQDSSTSHAISNIYKKLTQNSDKRVYSCYIFLDLTKAFDIVSCDVFLYKMKNFYGFRKLAFKIKQSYLSYRKHYTKLNNSKSDQSKEKYGVPQGSSLGWLLFFSYINDFRLASEFDTIVFADATFLALSDNNLSKLQGRVNIELSKIDLWMKKTNYI